jgi:phosphoribosylformimino-5-aminoimidazole carboxamide ribotide isomerase
VAAILAAVAVPVEVGGGIRSLEQARRWIDAGAERVIFGTAAVTEPATVRAAVEAWGPRVAVAIDARDGRVAVEGWTRTEALPAVELAARVADWGVTRVQYTDVSRDGGLTGLDTASIADFARAAPLRLTVGGGVHALSDLAALRALEPLGVDEVIVGRALYDARFSLAEALEACA